jgi:membrane protein DedA with SNARE-associated domain
MPWRKFLIANAAGAVLWASVFGFGGFFFGKLLLRLHHAVAIPVFVLALSAFFVIGYFINRYEHHLVEAAERDLPGPLKRPAAG